jgi:putative Mg2+ transporter-C (MgtC) family protein
MDPVTDELFGVPSATQAGIFILRLAAAGVLGGLLGAEREYEGKAAGLRTHMLVALGAALFVIAPRAAGLEGAALASVVQGVAAGIGFIGAGTILKLSDREEIKGLTTAASIWLTAAVGIAAGVAPLWVPVAGTSCAWVVLYVFAKIEKRMSKQEPENTP